MTIKTNIIFLGAPGTGKGTQSNKLAEMHNFARLSVGDELRKIDSKQASQGSLMQLGTVISIVDHFLSIHAKQNCIFDGYPRSLNQAKILDVLCNEYNTQITHVIELTIDSSVVIKRLQNRVNCQDCKKSFVQHTSQCQYCGSYNIFQRIDDLDIGVIQKRIEIFETELYKIRDYYYSQNNIQYIQIPADSSIDTIYSNIVDAILEK